MAILPLNITCGYWFLNLVLLLTCWWTFDKSLNQFVSSTANEALAWDVSKLHASCVFLIYTIHSCFQIHLWNFHVILGLSMVYHELASLSYSLTFSQHQVNSTVSKVWNPQTTVFWNCIHSPKCAELKETMWERRFILQWVWVSFTVLSLINKYKSALC